MEFISGLVSVSFRGLSPESIIEITKSSHLRAIEWGGDIHVPAGNIELAKSVRSKTEAAGLCVCEYGSYYRLGKSDRSLKEHVIASARALGADKVRLWAFDKNRSSTTDEEYRSIVQDAQEICDMGKDLIFCLECHNNTLTEDHRDTLEFLKDVGRDNLRMFWQPNQFRDHEYNLDSLSKLLPYVHSVHVFSWEKDKKLPLEAHEDRWLEYLSILKSSHRDKIYLMLEFMHDGSKDSLKHTASVLNGWIERL